MDIYRPTYLYIKKHSITGLQYFGKTTKNDPYLYKGSGKRWLNHIKKHGTQYVETVWVKLFIDESELVSFAKQFSIENNIVESENWANLCIETGLDGGLRHNSFDIMQKINSTPKSQEVRSKMGLSISKARMGKKQSPNCKEKITHSLKSKPVGTCPKCGKTAKLLGRFLGSHFDKCSA